MMDLDIRIENLHTVARRYCLEQHEYWVEKYSRINQLHKRTYTYSKKELNIFPRYNVLKAILDGVEEFIPKDFDSLKEEKEILAEMASTANSIFTEPPNEQISDQAMLEEREKFIQFIENFPEDDLFRVKPLFYRRVLSQEERTYHQQQLKNIWGVEKEYYYPLELVDIDKPLLVFQDEYFEAEFGFKSLQKILNSHQVHKVWGLIELDPDYEIELGIFEPFYGRGGEGYWFSEGYEWLIYVSHENSLTLGGQWLINEIKTAWTNWKQRIWSSSYLF
ncbi:MAG: hypothetical protein F6J87_29445 [Spirulina sp. SIO3F2]|nr:hypothetical protein [Spirulina sp. SIO3F2]